MTDHKYLQSYLFNLPSHYMYAVLKFKGANHRMPIVNGRCSNIAVDARKCTLCNVKPRETGIEFHYLFKCPFFKEGVLFYLSLIKLNN